MGIKYFLLVVFFFVCIRVFAQNDAIRLTINLYPVQMLTLEAQPEVDENMDMVMPEKRQLIISSPSGFQVDASHGSEYTKKMHDLRAKRSSVKTLCNRVHHLFETARGAVEKKYSIDKSMEKIIQKIGCSDNENSDHLVLTLISQ
ncbi:MULTISPECIES: hypothetical protein [Chryseobacterium]|uniref:Uncharacterized protein n=1 Tax=Chryseobacterium camelliae TaxID=1265445 RepID=A0ABU0TFV2_9FLAO|nr:MULTISPECIES: hypothetical protein [Chryseobacterium]MDT3406261.1 hypothetical protein [Pseudacidovorax intermedius]MDQ1095940.1 hypothetical protein [Chryseobacterium camelliae]MDQ1099876.1 hypothetical protein [Chryseobacterium sp. SORGH_AS_1048]MDR6087222.1 hypothetical protein [Chryseobacterium sp. SORGH_AS_0909]MDR6131596.1 hypothetical protein [Chryseobacterium sp. SORGH_AS_1175]